MNRTRRNGTTLVELLVVIVVFLIGILAILQIFPGGFKVLQNTRSMAVARQLARAEMERSKSYADTMAEMILDVRYQLGAGFVDIFTDANHFSNDLGHGGEGMDVNGHVISGGDRKSVV